MAVAGGQKHHAVDTATRERWGLLGRLFRARRLELGYLTRYAFAEARLPKTLKGNVNERMVIAIENNERPGSYAPGRLEQWARALEVTKESVYAVLHGEADELTPAPAPPPGHHRPPPDSGYPFGDDDQVAADRPYAEEIHARLRQLEREGTVAETATGAQVFRRPGEENDAAFWDGCIRDMWNLERRLWMAARVRRLQAEQQRNDRPRAG